LNEKIQIKEILKNSSVIAIVGVSRDSTKDSNRVCEYLMKEGYQILVVNPFIKEVLGKECRPSITDIPNKLKEKIEIVNIFRPSEDVPKIVDEAISIKEKYGNLKVIWTQLGISHRLAAKKARESGIIVIEDKCIRTEHQFMV
tara:strand:- start:274 stop:702 length:429 start_codon:yes stop_codon:yes gene_type:complete